MQGPLKLDAEGRQGVDTLLDVMRSKEGWRCADV